MRFELKTANQINKLRPRVKINNWEELKEFPEIFPNNIKGRYFDTLDLILKIMNKHIVMSEISFILHLGNENEKPIHFEDLEVLWDFIIINTTFEEKVKILDAIDDFNSEIHHTTTLNNLYLSHVLQ